MIKFFKRYQFLWLCNNIYKILLPCPAVAEAPTEENKFGLVVIVLLTEFEIIEAIFMT